MSAPSSRATDACAMRAAAPRAWPFRTLFTAPKASFAQLANGAIAVLQLNPPIPMNTPKGEGFAHILIDYGPESDLYWTVLITETGEIWTYANRFVRASKNITLGRSDPSPPIPCEAGRVPMRPRSVDNSERA